MLLGRKLLAVDDLLEPIIAAAAGGGGTAWLMKIMFQNWLKKQDKTNEMVRDHDKELAVLKHRIEVAEKDINGLGAALRKGK